MPKISFFQLSKLNKYCLGVELTPAHAPGDEKAQNGSSVGLHAVSHSMLQRLQNVIKKKQQQQQQQQQKGHASY